MRTETWEQWEQLVEKDVLEANVIPSVEYTDKELEDMRQDYESCIYYSYDLMNEGWEQEPKDYKSTACSLGVNHE
jgi:hypothetical protein